MERYCSTGQSLQRAVAPMEEEEDFYTFIMCYKSLRIGVWKRLHNEELYELCFSPNILGGIKSRRKHSAGHVARIGNRNVRKGFWWRDLRARHNFNPLNLELNPICYLLALLGAHHFLHVSRITVKLLTFRLLMSYIYIYGIHILDVSRSHKTTQHSR